MRSRRLLILAAAALLSTGVTAGVTGQAARAGTIATPSWGAANLISYADSDFESGVGDWVADTGTTLSQDTTQAFLHDDSLKAVATASGSQSFKLGPDAGQVNVTAGDQYRVSAWFKAPASSGRTITWAMAFYNSGGTWIGWTSGTADTLTASGGWQYASAVITAPAGASYDYGGPRVTEAGVASAGEALNMDEVLVEPYRAATIIGAEDTSGDCGSFTTANTAIGPLQSCKIFYGPTKPLPSAWSGSVCANLPANVTCVITFKDFANASNNLATYVSDIPAGKNVILIPYQEPENPNDTWTDGTLTGGPAYVAEAETEIGIIRGALTAANRANVFIADDSMDYQYDTAGSGHSNGTSCSFIIPSSYVDFYLDDHYEFSATGNNMPADTPDSDANKEWDNWLSCASPQHKPIGLAEYGLNCGQNNGTGAAPDALTTSEGISADQTYLEGQLDGLPVVLWEYWWDTNGDSSGNCQFTTGGSPDGTQAVKAWQSAETQNGGGAD